MGNFYRSKIVNFKCAQFDSLNKSLFIFGEHYRFYSTVANLITFITPVFRTNFYVFFFRPDLCRNYALDFSLTYFIPALVVPAAVCGMFLLAFCLRAD